LKFARSQARTISTVIMNLAPSQPDRYQSDRIGALMSALSGLIFSSSSIAAVGQMTPAWRDGRSGSAHALAPAAASSRSRKPVTVIASMPMRSAGRSAAPRRRAMHAPACRLRPASRQSLAFAMRRSISARISGEVGHEEAETLGSTISMRWGLIISIPYYQLCIV
jgi:hypothetical protein